MIQTLILHAGTPKTGTTSLQVYLDRQREALMHRGIFYPHIEKGINQNADALKRKHQWIVWMLQASDGQAFSRRIDRLLAEADPTIHTLILSTEGLFHHWWDFSPAGREALASLAERLSVRVWVWFREPVAFIRANYIQMLKNPRLDVACYGRDLSLDEMLDDPWFSKHLDYIGYVREVEKVLGRGAVVPFAYRGDTIEAFLNALGVTGLEPADLNENRTLGEYGVALLRGLNRFDLSAERKRIAVEHITGLDAIVRPIWRPLTLAPATVSRVRDLASESIAALERDFGLSLESPAPENASEPVL
jgi:hypothetical protein